MGSKNKSTVLVLEILTVSDSHTIAGRPSRRGRGLTEEVCSHHRQDDQSRNSPHGHVSQQLHQLVSAGRNPGRENIKPQSFCFKQWSSVFCKHLESGFSWIVSNKDTEERYKERPCYLSWKKKTYVDPTQAMTHISQRMWQDQGPSSLSINLRRHTGTFTILTSHEIHQAANRSWTAVTWPTRESRRRLWRSRWPFCRTCGNAAPTSYTVTKRRARFQIMTTCKKY